MPEPAEKKRKLSEIVVSSSDSPESLADWIELKILCDEEHSISIRDTIAQLKIGGDVVPLDPDNDQGQSHDELLEPIVEGAFNEIGERLDNCGEHFPFTLEEEVVYLHNSDSGIVYQFLALLSYCGKDAGPEGHDGSKLFEEICAKAIEGYLGQGSGAYIFGFPRRIGPPGFGNAVDHLCELIGEGSKRSGRNPKEPMQKDAKLDIVGWKDFGDKRFGKLIAFGQCATGAWKGKLTELPPTNKWCQNWMKDPPTVDPVRCFFVPHRIETNEWVNACMYGGILFDRCRILNVLTELTEDLIARIREWVNHAKVNVLCA